MSFSDTTNKMQEWYNAALQKLVDMAGNMPSFQKAPPPVRQVPMMPYIPKNRKTGKHPTAGTALEHYLKS